MIDKLREYWLKKSVKQRIYIIIFSVLMIAFFICIVKGNIIDPIINSGSESEQQADINFHVNPVDIGVLAIVGTGYAIHKIRNNRKEKR